MSGVTIPLPDGWWSEGGLTFVTDNFEEDVRVERRRPDLDAVGAGPENQIQWCAMEDGVVVSGHEMLHDAFRVFEEDWVASSELDLEKMGGRRS